MNPYEVMVDELERYHGAGRSEAGRRIAMELMCEGYNVTSDFVRFRVGAPWVFSYRMEQFYSETDGFLYELLSWHHQGRRARWRHEIASKVSECFPDGARVLALGDGIGFDSLEICRRCSASHVTSFEFVGASSRFAGRRAEAEDAEVKRRLSFVHDLQAIPRGAFDVVICLDVLEHVINPPSVIADIAAYLKVGGQVIVSEAFGAVYPFKPTHLRSNLRHAGRTFSLFRRAGFSYEETFCDRIYRFSRGPRDTPAHKRLKELRDSARLEAIGALARLQFWRHFGARKIDLDRVLKEAMPVDGRGSSFSELLVSERPEPSTVASR